MVSIKEIAKRAGVSINTVSRALNRRNKESWHGVAERADEIRRIAVEMGYRPNSAARAMRTKDSRHIGVLMSGAYTSPYEFPVIMGINEQLQALGYSVSIIDASEIDPEKPELALPFREQMFSGIFIMHVPGPVGEYARTIAPIQVDLDSNLRGPFNCVYRNEFKSGYEVGSRMAKLGAKRMLYAGNRQWKDCHLHITDRLDGFKKAASDFGFEPVILELGFAKEEYILMAERLVEALKETRCLVANDQPLAFWCANAASRIGFCAGRDYALASCAEMVDCSNVWPWLSRMSFDRFELGRKAADMMTELLEGKRQVPSIELSGSWIQGETAMFVK